MPLTLHETKILTDHGWEIVCESPLQFELYSQFAGGIHTLSTEEEQKQEINRIMLSIPYQQIGVAPIIPLINKVDWDTYFMAQCFLISMRSMDTTKHGSIIVDSSNRVISQGYNGPIDGINDSLVPMTRPEKYSYMIHAEENAILSLNGPVPPDSKIYVTGRPCHKCTRMILRKGIRHIIYGPQESKCVDQKDIDASNFMITQTNTKLTKFDKTDQLYQLLNKYVIRINDVLFGEKQ